MLSAFRPKIDNLGIDLYCRLHTLLLACPLRMHGAFRQSRGIDLQRRVLDIECLCQRHN